MGRRRCEEGPRVPPSAEKYPSRGRWTRRVRREHGSASAGRCSDCSASPSEPIMWRHSADLGEKREPRETTCTDCSEAKGQSPLWRVSLDILRGPRLLGVIFRLGEVRSSGIRSQPPPFQQAKRPRLSASEGGNSSLCLHQREPLLLS